MKVNVYFVRIFDNFILNMTKDRELLDKKKMYTIYFFAIFVYSLPLFSLGIFAIDLLTANTTEMFFWVLFLVGMAPCGVVGIVLSAIGLWKSIKQKNLINKNIGVIGIVGGLLFLGGGFLGLMLVYLVYVVVGD